MNSFNISVIIPVYNADKFIQKAIESAVNQEFVSEVLVVNDNSTDNSVRIIKEIQKSHPSIRLIEHKFDYNVGAGEARNIGVNAAINNWLAFLDVDDYYYDNRFENAVEIIRNNPDADGVYEAVENVFENQTAERNYYTTRPERYKTGVLGSKINLFTTDFKIEPNALSKCLILGNDGFIHLNGLVIRKTLLVKAGVFNVNLKLTQDTDILFKLSALGRLEPGNIDTPVSARLVHQGNRIYSNADELNYYTAILFSDLKEWCVKKKINSDLLNVVNEQTIKFCAKKILKINLYTKPYRVKFFLIGLFQSFLLKRFIDKKSAIYQK